MADIRVLIVGAGVTGLATAHALARRGVSVTVVDRGPIPNPIASSFDRHRLIRTHYPDYPVYVRRIAEAHQAWRQLAEELGEQIYVETGVIAVSLEVGDWTDRARIAMEAVGEPHERLDPAAFARRFPQFDIPDFRECLYTPTGGALLADRILHGYVRLLKRLGVTFVEHCPIVAVDPAAASVTAADGRTFSADRLVVAPGVGAPALFKGFVDVELIPRRSVLLYVDPPAALADAWARGPSWVDLGTDDEFWGIPPVAGIPMKMGLGAVGPDGDPAGDRVMRPGEVEKILAAYAPRVKDIGGFRLVEGHANWWTLAPGERFVFKRVERADFLSACSGHGFKFGALTGEDVARAVTGEEAADAVSARLAALELPAGRP